VDAQGLVLYDGSTHRPLRWMSADEQSDAQAILVGGQVVGHLVVAMPMRGAVPGPLEQRFLDRMHGLLITASVVAGALGLVLALTLSRSLSAPLQRLAVAARTVAGGDLSHRVAAGGSAEVAEVSTAFNEMAEGLQKAETLRQNLMADVAHELRTPLTVLRGNLQAILEGVFPADRRELQVLFDETQLLSRLVDDVRELALADAGRLSMDLRATDIGQVIRASMDSLQPRAAAQGVNLEVHVPDDLPLAWADADRVAQVLSNLLTNALRYTPSAGKITVAAQATAEGIEVMVRDTGEGIAPDDLPHIFDRFWRQDSARRRDERSQGGSGLGLSIARSLIKAQGGRIWAESSPGQGATFRFVLPTHVEAES